MGQLHHMPITTPFHLLLDYTENNKVTDSPKFHPWLDIDALCKIPKFGTRNDHRFSARAKMWVE